jgi:hypothetical protein
MLRLLFRTDHTQNPGSSESRERLAQVSGRNKPAGERIGRQADDVEVTVEPAMLKPVIEYEYRPGLETGREGMGGGPAIRTDTQPGPGKQLVEHGRLIAHLRPVTRLAGLDDESVP